MFKHLNLLFALAAVSILLHEFYPAMIEYYRLFWLSRDVDAFYDAMVEASNRSLSVEIGPKHWGVYQGGIVVRQGDWKDGEKLGTNIPGWRLYFDNEGACRTVQGAACASENEEHEGTAHAIAITSDAPRIYTVEFDDSGKPVIFKDDFNLLGDMP